MRERNENNTNYTNETSKASEKLRYAGTKINSSILHQIIIETFQSRIII